MSLLTLDTAAQILADMPGCVRALDLSVEDLQDGHATLRMPYSDMSCRQDGTFSGQALATLADTAMCFALWMDGRGRRPIATVDLHVTYMRSANGEDVLGRAQLVRSGRAMAFAQVDIVVASSGRQIASAVATFTLSA